MKSKAFLSLNLFLVVVVAVLATGTNNRAFARSVSCKSANRSSNMIKRSGYLRYQSSAYGGMVLRICYYKDNALVIERDSPQDPDITQFAIAGYCKSGGGSFEHRGRIDDMMAFDLWTYAAERVGCR